METATSKPAELSGSTVSIIFLALFALCNWWDGVSLVDALWKGAENLFHAIGL